MTDITIEEYTEKSIVVRGNTKDYKDALMELGGKWNPGLRNGAGWIFPKTKLSVVEDLKKNIVNGKIKKGVVTDKVYEKKSYEQSDKTPAIDIKNFVSTKDYLDLLSRVERLEQICSHIDFVKKDKSETKPLKTKSQKTKDIIMIDSSEDEETEESPKVERMLKKKK